MCSAFSPATLTFFIKPKNQKLQIDVLTLAHIKNKTFFQWNRWKNFLIFIFLNEYHFFYRFATQNKLHSLLLGGIIFANKSKKLKIQENLNILPCFESI